MSLIKGRTSGPTPSAARGPSASKFQYRARSAEEVKARANRPIGGGESYIKEEAERFQPAQGPNTIRILPPTWDDAKHYGLDVWVHFGIGPDKSAFLDLDKMFGDPDPINEARVQAVEAGEEALAKALRSRPRVMVYLIDRKNEEKGPLVWSMPAGLDKDFVNGAIDPDTGAVLSLDDPGPEGFDITFTRTGEGIKTEYSAIRVSRNPRPLSDDPKKADQWLQYISDNPLPALLVRKSYDELKAAYQGTKVETPDEKDGGKPSKVPARGARTAAAAPKQEERSPQEDAAGPTELPSWEEVHGASVADIEEMVATNPEIKAKLEADDTIDSEEKLKDKVCELFGIKAPAPRTGTSTGLSWKEKLAKQKAGGK